MTLSFKDLNFADNLGMLKDAIVSFMVGLPVYNPVFEDLYKVLREDFAKVMNLRN